MRLLLDRKPLFFLCDIQERFKPLIFQFNAVVHTANKLIKASDILNIPLIVTEQYPKALGKTCAELNISRAQIVEPKTKFSMLTPNILEILKTNFTGSKDVVLFGIESHVCVLQTALELRELDYNVFVVQDGISSANASERPIAVERLRQAGCVIATSDSLLFELVQDASSEKFKQISQLVKESMDNVLHNKLAQL